MFQTVLQTNRNLIEVMVRLVEEIIQMMAGQVKLQPELILHPLQLAFAHH